ncbi:MAG TPA: aldose 1-epimerase [Acidobacteriota bacterium]|nr:aldose 1-epimerase [Acidobacteriota bacterium]
MTQAGNYIAERATVDGVEVVHLKDAAHRTEVSIVPSFGNNAYEMKVNGKQIFWSPYRTLKELLDQPAQAGNPLLSPWANRIDGDAYWANGKKYLLNPELKNFRYDNNRKPIHGLVVYAKEWRVTEIKSDANSASVTSRLEFWRRADWMAQFPFAHNIEMTYRLKDGALEVVTTVENLSAEPMPLSLGYHTYYRMDDSTRDEWTVHVPAREHVEVSGALIPTGETKPSALSDPQPLRNFVLDDGFTNLIRDSARRAEFWVQGRSQKIRVIFGPRYSVAVVFAPQGRDFICFEPMVGVTNVFNLAHTGLYKELQSISPGESWKESFWIVPEGY